MASERGSALLPARPVSNRRAPHALPCDRLVSLQSVDFVQILVQFSVLLLSLTVHEAAHAWTADRLGDPTARLLGRVTLNPAAHVDLIGTVLFPLVAMISNVPLIGWARPVPVNLRNLPHPRRDYLFVAAAGPVEQPAARHPAARRSSAPRRRKPGGSRTGFSGRCCS